MMRVKKDDNKKVASFKWHIHVIIYAIMLCFTDTRYSFKCLWIKGRHFLVLKCKALASLKLEDGFPASSRGWQVTRCWRTEETTEMKLQSESSLPGVYHGALARALFFLCWLQTFLGREREVFKAQTLRKLAPRWEARQPPVSHSRCLPPSTALCCRSRLLTQATHGIKKKSSPSYRSRTQHTSKNTATEHNLPSFGRTNREIPSQFVQSLPLLILCKQSQLAGRPVRWRTARHQSVSTLLSMHQCNFLIHTCAVHLFLRNK